MKQIKGLLLYLGAVLILSACGGGVPDPNDPNPTDPNPPPTNQLPYAGTITLDEYDWYHRPTYRGVISLNLPRGEKTRVAAGKFPRRYENGDVLFLQGCGARVNHVAKIDTQGLITVLTPCSSEIANPGSSNTDFEFSRRSPDGQKLAVEAKWWVGGDYNYLYSTVVFDASGSVLEVFDGYYAPEWTHDNRLLLTGQGFYLTDANLKNLSRIDGKQLNGIVNNPAMHPSKDYIAFEYNQQIWGMNLDGSELQQLIRSTSFLRFPAWSPDGQSLVYLAVTTADYYDQALYFTDLTKRESYALDIQDILEPPLNTSVVPNGPLSWTE